MQSEVVEAYPEEDLAVYVVWVPMIPSDNEAAARRSATMYRDPRLRQYYDPERLTGIAFSKDVKPEQFRELIDSLADDDPLEQRIKEWFSKPPEERPVWDVVYFFPPGVTWADSVPKSMTWMKQVGFFGPQTGVEPSGLFFRQSSKERPAESDWFVEIRVAMTKLIPQERSAAKDRPQEAVPTASTDPPRPACTLPPDQRHSRREQLLGLAKRAKEVTDVENGMRLRFEDSAGLLAELVQVVEQERTCCSFLRFGLTVEPDNGPITIEVTGPPGTREMLRSLSPVK